MSTLVPLGLANAACAALLALLAVIAGRFCRRPAVLHSLWLLVLLKLVTPPFWPITIANLPEEPAAPVEAAPPPMLMESASFAQSASPQRELVGWMNATEGQPLQARFQNKQSIASVQGRADSIDPVKIVPAADIEFALGQPQAAAPPPFVDTPAPTPQSQGLQSLVPFLGVVWLAGVVVWLLWAMLHVGRFQHLLRHARPAGADIQEQADRLARQMGLRNGPEVWLLPGPLPPLVWAAIGRVRIFFPAKLLQRLDETERASLLAHELAHVRRRDHWVRWLELIASALYWWYPLVWLARRRMHIHEEECCDAWVVGEVPARTYAAAILNTLDFLAEDQMPLPVMASGLAGLEMLKRRLKLIMGAGTPKRLSAPAKCVLVFVGLLALSLRPNLAQSEEKTEPAVEPPAAKAEAAPAVVLDEPTVFNSQPKNLLGGNNDVWSVAVSPDGKRLVTGSGYWDRPGEVRVWDLGTHKLLMALAEPMGVASVAISPDGKRLASANWAREGRLRDLATGKELLRLPLDSVARVAFSPDGKLLGTASENKTVKLWDAVSGKEIADLKGDLFRWHCIQFSRDGKLVAVGGGDWNEGGLGQVTLWNVQTHMQIGKLTGHDRPILALHFAPDNKTIATGGLDKSVRLWDAATFKLLASLEGHEHWVECVAFSPDGKKLVSASHDKSVRVWDVEQRTPIARLDGHDAEVRSAAFSPDGKLLVTGGANKTLKLWDAATNKEIATLMRNPLQGDKAPQILGMAGSPDGKLLATALEDQTIQVRDAVSGDILHTLTGHTDAVQCLAFSPDGKTLASGSPDLSVRLWDPASGVLRRTLAGHTNWIYAVVFSPDGKTLASAGYDRTIRLWDSASGETRRILKGHKASVRALAFAPDGKTLASGSGDRTIKLWSMTGDDAPVTLKGHEGAVRAVAFAPDGKTLASASEDQTVKLWDVAKQSERATLKGHTAEVVTLAFSPGGKTLATGGADNILFLWDPATGAQRNALRGHNDAVTTVLFAPDGQRLVSSSLDRTVKLWQAQLTPIRLLRGHTGPVASLVISRDGRRLISGSGWPQGDKTTRLWDLKTSKELRSFRVKAAADGGPPEPPTQISAVALSPDGKLAVSAGASGVVFLWDVETGAELRRFHGHVGDISALDFTPDGRQVLSGGSDKTIRLWEVKTGRQVRKFEGHTNWVRSVRFARDGLRFLSGGRDGVMRLWDVDSGKQLRQFQAAPKGWAETVVWMPDNRWALCNGSGEGDFQLWDVESGAVVRTFKGHVYGVTCVDVSPDGRSILSGGYDGTVRWWDAATGQQRKLFRHPNFVRAVKFSPDGRLAVSAGGGRSEGAGKYGPGGTEFPIRVWSLADERTAQAMKKETTRK